MYLNENSTSVDFADCGNAISGYHLNFPVYLTTLQDNSEAIKSAFDSLESGKEPDIW